MSKTSEKITAHREQNDTSLSVPMKGDSRTAAAGRERLLFRNHNHVVHLVETRSPKSVPVGWKGKSSSKATYAQYGASNGLDRSFQFGDKNNRRDKEDRSNHNGRGTGQERGGGGEDRDNDPPKDEDKILSDFSSSHGEDLEGLSGDELEMFGGTPRPVREAKSLFSHEYEDEMRSRVETSTWIHSEHLKTGDSSVKQNRIFKEQRRQKLWDASYAAKENARMTREPRPLNLPFDDGILVGCWMWSKRYQSEKDTPVEATKVFTFLDVYQKCFAWKPFNRRILMWESDLQGIPAPLLYSTSASASRRSNDYEIVSPSVTKAYLTWPNCSTDEVNTSVSTKLGVTVTKTTYSKSVCPDYFEIHDNTKEWLLAAKAMSQQLPGWICGYSALASIACDDMSGLLSPEQLRVIYINDPSGHWRFVEVHLNTVYVWAS